MRKSTILTVVAILAILAILAIVVIALVAVTREKLAGAKMESLPLKHIGRWRPARGAGSDEPLSAVEQERLKQLRAVPYLQGYHKAAGGANVTVYDASRAFAGLNLVVSGHEPEASIMDMEAKVLHTWRFDSAENLWPKNRAAEAKSHWRRVHLYANGDILAIYDGVGMIKLGRDSNLLWHFGEHTHHDVDVTADGLIYILTRRGSIVPGMNGGDPILEDFITVLAPEGTVIETHSLVRFFQESVFRDIPVPHRRRGDIFHTNTIQVLDGRHAGKSDIFRRGNVLVSILHIDTLAIADLEKQTIVWAADGRETGNWQHQHDPVLLENGNMLLFDNNRRLGASKILEFEPLTGKEIWAYRGTASDPFYSKTCGTNQRLPNGNTLITESDYGRAFEVTPEGKKVWEYVNPHRAGANGELIATLLDVVRLEPGDVEWLK